MSCPTPPSTPRRRAGGRGRGIRCRRRGGHAGRCGDADSRPQPDPPVRTGPSSRSSADPAPSLPVRPRSRRAGGGTARRCGHAGTATRPSRRCRRRAGGPWSVREGGGCQAVRLRRSGRGWGLLQSPCVLSFMWRTDRRSAASAPRVGEYGPQPGGSRCGPALFSALSSPVPDRRGDHRPTRRERCRHSSSSPTISVTSATAAASTSGVLPRQSRRCLAAAIALSRSTRTYSHSPGLVFAVVQ